MSQAEHIDQMSNEEVEEIQGDEVNGSASTGKPKRTMSTIEFPYYELDSCIDIIRKVHEQRGQSIAAPDQVAAWIGSVATSGTYKLRMSATRMFGLLGGERGTVRISDLAARVLDPTTERQARIEAFLNVQLYRKVYEANRGRLLPKQAGIEAEMVALGVAPNQKAKARVMFERSARAAGFFDHGIDRLVEPSFNGAAPSAIIPDPPEETLEPVKRAAPERKPEVSPVADDPLVQGLLNRMPPPGEGWPVAERARWLQAFSMNLSLIYGDQGEVRITPILDPDIGRPAI